MNQDYAFVAAVDDPENVTPAKGALCVLSEYHLSILRSEAVLVFECWRCQAAREAGKKPFTAVRVELSKDHLRELKLQQSSDPGEDSYFRELVMYVLKNGLLPKSVIPAAPETEDDAE